MRTTLETHTYFKNIKVGQNFLHNGNTCIKVSTRTAAVGEYGYFYFKQNDLCKITS